MYQVLWHDITAIAPLLVLCGGALALLLFEVFLPKQWPRALFATLVLLAALGCAFWDIVSSRPVQTIFNGMLYGDSLAQFFTILLIGGSLLAVLLGAKRLSQEGVQDSSEYYSLLLMSTAGALVFASAAELITLFIGLETMSLALYSLCGAALNIKRSTEAALKYFLLGSFSSAFLLYGIALFYGLSGSTEMEIVADTIGALNEPLLFFAVGLMLVGLVFKIGLVPFHFWTPDVYEGAPTSVTAYMACVIKAAAVGAALRVLWIVLGDLGTLWHGALWVLVALTMAGGNIIALRQRSLKRMLAYSSIGHAGYIMMAFLALGDRAQAGGAILYYLVVYAVMTIGAFGVVLIMTAHRSAEDRPDDITRLNGLGYTHPFLAVLMALFMLSLAGIPPGVAGLLGKVYLFSAAIQAGYTGLVIIGVLSAAIACFYYLRVIVAMYFINPASDSDRVYLDLPLLTALSFCALGVIIFGIFPGMIYESALQAVRGF